MPCKYCLPIKEGKSTKFWCTKDDYACANFDNKKKEPLCPYPNNNRICECYVALKPIAE